MTFEITLYLIIALWFAVIACNAFYYIGIEKGRDEQRSKQPLLKKTKFGVAKIIHPNVMRDQNLSTALLSAMLLELSRKGMEFIEVKHKQYVTPEEPNKLKVELEAELIQELN